MMRNCNPLGLTITPFFLAFSSRYFWLASMLRASSTAQAFATRAGIVQPASIIAKTAASRFISLSERPVTTVAPPTRAGLPARRLCWQLLLAILARCGSRTQAGNHGTPASRRKYAPSLNRRSRRPPTDKNRLTKKSGEFDGQVHQHHQPEGGHQQPGAPVDPLHGRLVDPGVKQPDHRG